MGHSQIMWKREERRSKAKEERRKEGSLGELGLSTSIGIITARLLAVPRCYCCYSCIDERTLCLGNLPEIF